MATPFLSQRIEEFHILTPMDLHGLAMDKFMQYRKEIDPKANLDYDSPLMKMAQEYAVKRFIVKPERELALRSVSESGGVDYIGNTGVKALPVPMVGPVDGSSILAAAVTTQSLSHEVVSRHTAHSMAVSFSEDIGMGAVSKAGALPAGGDGAWIQLAEDKLKKDNQLDYQALLWEIGSQVSEESHIKRGGMNLTEEQDMLIDMNTWFLRGGGNIHYVEPSIEKNGFKLMATEDIDDNEVLLSIPLKLIMCKQTARNVLIKKKGKYLGEELTKTFEKDEEWGLAIFLLHEYYKEVNGDGSKWGPFLRTLRIRSISTETISELKGSKAEQLLREWTKRISAFLWWSTGSEGPCTPVTGICRSKPKESHGDSRYTLHQIKWAYWVVKQNSVRVKQLSTGLEFLALIPYFNMAEKKQGVSSVTQEGRAGKENNRVEKFDPIIKNANKIIIEKEGGASVTFGLDGSVLIRSGSKQRKGSSIGINPGNLTDPDFFLRFLTVPLEENPHNFVKLNLPGVIPEGSKFHFCMKGTLKEQNRDVCKGAYKSEAMFWKTKVLGEWRSTMNLPPRMQELRMWAIRLHLYGGKEEMEALSKANQAIAGLPIPVEQMSAEEQMMLLGITTQNDQGGYSEELTRPQLYAAPDPTDDPEAQRAMESLATLAVQAQMVYATGNLVLNATRSVLNHTRDFFLHGVLPSAGLDQLDEFLLKKIGMISHCGFENNMRISSGNISEELLCAMRVHLMNETEIAVFCPLDVRIWEENCHNVEFLNFTAISESNELIVVKTFENSINSLLYGYLTTYSEDINILQDYNTIIGEQGENRLGPIAISIVRLRLREKRMLLKTLEFLQDYEEKIHKGLIIFQLELKAKERIEANLREIEQQRFIDEIQKRIMINEPLAILDVNLGDNKPPKRIQLELGQSLNETVKTFCQMYSIDLNDQYVLIETLRKKVASPKPLLLLMGVIVPTGDRRILSIPEGSNSTIETNVFCARYDIKNSYSCEAILNHVNERLYPAFIRNIIIALPITAPDSRTLKLVIREGEQHDLNQFISDFFELNGLSHDAVHGMVQEITKRLPPVVLQIPVSLSGKRQISAVFRANINITTTVEGFVNFFEAEEGIKLALLKRARYGMAPGTFLV